MLLTKATFFLNSFHIFCVVFGPLDRDRKFHFEFFNHIIAIRKRTIKNSFSNNCLFKYLAIRQVLTIRDAVQF